MVCPPSTDDDDHTAAAAGGVSAEHVLWGWLSDQLAAGLHSAVRAFAGGLLRLAHTTLCTHCLCCRPPCFRQGYRRLGGASSSMLRAELDDKERLSIVRQQP